MTALRGLRLPSWLSVHLAAVRALLVLTVLLGIAYPLAITGIGRLPGLSGKADGSFLTADGTVIGSRLIGQSFSDARGNPLPQYFQSRPSAAGNGYDPTASGASNLGPESVVDTLPDPAKSGDTGTRSLLTQVCARSKSVGKLEHVSGSRPYCTADGVGAVLTVFRNHGLHGSVTRVVSVNQACPAVPFVRSYEGVAVSCAQFGEDYSEGIITPIRGNAPDHPAVPADAVTASGSGLDPNISPVYARLQAPRIAATRAMSVDAVRRLISDHTTGRTLGFMGETSINVVELNRALDKDHPYRG